MVDEHNINIMIYFTERSRSKYMYTLHLRHERVSLDKILFFVETWIDK